MKLYKVTDAECNTFNNTHWEIGKIKYIESDSLLCTNPMLCTNKLFHAFASPAMAGLFSDILLTYTNKPYRLFEAEGKPVVMDSIKCGCRSLTITKEIPFFTLSSEQKIIFIILCLCHLYYDCGTFGILAQNWLTKKDSTLEPILNFLRKGRVDEYGSISHCAIDYILDLANKSHKITFINYFYWFNLSFANVLEEVLKY